MGFPRRVLVRLLVAVVSCSAWFYAQDGAAQKLSSSPPAASKTPLGRAQAAYVQGNYRDALQVAASILAKDPENQSALRLTTAARCRVGENAKAKEAYERLDPSGRRLARELCSRVGVRLPATVSRERAERVKTDEALMAAAEIAFMASQHSRAIAAASEVAQRNPRHQQAYRIIAVSACYLGYRSLARHAQKLLNKKERQLAQQVCARLGL